jgi:hypothetical protein
LVVCSCPPQNKDDLFRKKIESVDIGIYFPQYTGGTEYSLGLTFIQDEYFARNLNEQKTIYCFGTDTRVLTDRGFMFEHEITAIVAEHGSSAVRFACFDAASQQLVYRTGKMVHPPNTDGELLTFTSAAEQARWSGGDEADEAEPSNRMSLRVTGNHMMYATLGDEADGAMAPPSKVLARNLLAECACPAHAECPHRSQQVRFLACASGGVAHSLQDQPEEFVSALHLQSKQQVTAFLELYGFWLGGSGSVDPDGVDFAHVDSRDEKWLERTLRDAGLVEGVDWIVTPERTVITKACWIDYFSGAYSCSFDSASADKTFWSWSLERLGQADLRSVLSGLLRAEGPMSSSAEGEHVLTSSSATMSWSRKVALLHAGYTAYFELASTKGCTDAPDADLWRVVYASYSSSSPSSLASSRPVVPCSGVRREKYAGALWCVVADHPDHLLVAQRAEADERGVVTRASRPVIVGNCHVTDATNTENIAFVWKATKHIILEQNLTRSGLLMC